jgi:RHS repeat-associated protein
VPQGSGVTQALAALAQYQAWLAAPAQVAARLTSLTAYANESGSQAAATDSGAFPNWIGQPGYSTSQAVGQAQLGKQFGSSTVQVTNGDGSHGVMVSSLPLDGTTPSGSSAPLNLNLSNDGAGGYWPDSSLVPVTLPMASTGQVFFPQDSLGLSFSSGAAVTGQQQGGTVFYPNVGSSGSDTDVVASADPHGAEITYVLRSAQSPQTQTITFSLPSGWSLAALPLDPNTIQVKDAAGTVQGTLLAPVATDAQGQPVAANYMIQNGNQVVLSVADQGGNYDFPIMVDPTFTITTSNPTGSSSSTNMFDYWEWSSTPSSDVCFAPATLSGSSDYAGVKAYSQNPPGTNCNYTQNWRAEFTIAAPSNANIYQYTLGGVTNNIDPNNPSVSWMQAGLEPGPLGRANGGFNPWINGSAGVTSDSSYSHNGSFQFCLVSGCGLDPGQYDGDLATMKLWMNGGTPGRAVNDSAATADVYLGDANAVPEPSFEQSQVGFWATSSAGELEVDIPYGYVPNTPGLGVASVSLADTTNNTSFGVDNGGGCSLSGYTIGCTSTTNPAPFYFNTSQLSSGVNTLVAGTSGYDYEEGSADAWIGIDNSTPTISWGGSLGNSGVDLLNHGQLQINASDSPSGIYNVQAQLDGQPITLSGSTQCGGDQHSTGCTASPTFTPTFSSGGWHQFTATAENWAGTESTTYTDNFAEIGNPTISANTGYQVGDTLTATPAAFSTNQYESSAPSVNSWQWLSCDVTGNNCVNIPHATGSQYTLTGGDVGSKIEVSETVNDPSGTTPATLTVNSGSQTSTPIQPAVGPGCTDSWTGDAGPISPGGTSYDWGNPSNWSAGVPSGSSSVACIRSAYGTPLVVDVEPYTGFSGAASVLALDAYGASIVVDHGGSLTTSETSNGSGVGNLTLGDTAGAGSLEDYGPFTVQGIPGSSGTGLTWGNGTISGSTITLTGTAVSQIAPTSTSASIVLNGATLVNNGTLTMVCTTANDPTNSLTELAGQGAAVIHNQGSMTFTGTSGAGDGCEFAQSSAASGNAFINTGTISNTNVAAVDIGWPFESDEAAVVNSTTISLYGGQNQGQPISGHWNGSSALSFEAGGSYSLTDDLADFGSQSSTTTDVTVEPAPGSTGGATVAFAKYIAGLSGSPTAPAATVAGGTWTYGTITADGPLTIGVGGSVTTLGNLVDNGSAPITQAGPVDVVNATLNGVHISNPSGYAWTVWGTTNITGSFNGTGAGSMTFYGPVNVASTPSITTTGSLTLLGAVSGTGNFSVTSGGTFYEQGGMSNTGTISVTSGGDAQLSGAITDLGSLSVTSTGGRVDISGAVNTQTLTASGTGLSVEGAIGNQAALSSVTLGLATGGSISLTGQLSTTNLTLNGASTGTTTATLDSGSATVGTLTANGVLLDNEGTLAIGTKLYGTNGSQITNDGIINANGATFNASTQGPASSFVNAAAGQLADPSNPSTPQNTVLLPYSGSTPTSTVSGGGTVSAAYLINAAGPNQYGGNNPAAPDMVDGACDQAADCGNGDWSTTETDMSVAGLGGPLALTRQYSSRLAGSEQTPGMFGYGWITPFEQRLYFGSGTVTVQTTTGSQAAFTLPITNGYYTPTNGIWATLQENSNNNTYTYTQPDGTTTAFNSIGLPTSVTNRQGQVTTYNYNAQNQLTSVTAPTTNGAGRSLTFQYITSGPGTGLVGTATDADGLQFTYSYDNLNNLRTVTESAAPGTGGGTSTAASPPTTPMWSYCYDGPTVNCSAANDTADLHELTTLTDADSNTTTITYQAGYVIHVQEPGDPQSERWGYQQVSPGVGKTTQTSPNGNQTVYYFNSEDEPTQTQYANGTTVNMVYNSNGDLTGEQNGARLGSATTDCNGNTGSGWTCYGYDKVGNQTSERNPDNQTTSWSYNINSGNPVTYHDLLSETLPSGETTTYNYDSGGQPLSVTVTPPQGSSTPSETTSMTYFPDEQLKTKQTPLQQQDNTQTTYTYDSYGDLATVTTPATSDFPSGTVTTYGYDLDGRQICETTPIVTAALAGGSPSRCVNSTSPGANPGEPANPATNTYAATSVYDGLGDLMSATNPQGNTTTYTYSAAAQVVTKATPSSNVANVTTYLYCPNGQVEQTTIGNGTGTPALTEANTYDNDNNLTSQTTGASTNGCLAAAPSGGRTYTYGYNNMDQLSSETPPSGLSSEATSYTYDGNGNVKTIVYPANTNGTVETTTYGYDGEDQLNAVSYSDGETSVAKTYTPDGQVATMSDTTGDTSYLYDGLDRLSYVCVDGSSFTTTVGTCPGGRPISYGYDGDNDQTSIGYPNGQTVQQQFTAADQLASVTDWSSSPNTTSFHYDADGNLLTTNFPTATGENDNYSYNLDDAMTGVTMNKTGVTGGLASITLTRYPDDSINTESTGGTPGLPGPTLDTYCYTQQRELSLDITTANPSCTSSTENAYSYDSARNLTQLNGSGAGSLSYNNDNELCWTSTSSSTNGCSTPPTGAATYAYNPIGERKSFTPTSGTGSAYTYNADENLTQANVAGTTLTYTYDGNGQLQTRTIGSSTQPLTWDDTAGVPHLLAWGTNEYYIYGPGETAVEQISSSGTVQYLHQDQIGSTRLITSSTGTVVGSFTYNPYGGVLAKTGTATSYLGYAGQYTDEKSGFVYDQARWYDPATGQFMVVDPKVESTWQAYAYANDNPLTTIDPTGLQGSQMGPYNCAYKGNYPTAASRAECLRKQIYQQHHGFNLAGAVAHFVGQHAGQIAEGFVVVACTGASGGTAAAACVGLTVAAFAGATAQSIAQHRFSIGGTLADAMMAVPGLQGAGLELMPEATYGKILTEEARSGNLAPARLLGGATGATGSAYSWTENH